MDQPENEVSKTLREHLKGATSSTIEGLARRIGILPSERILLTTDIGIALAATSLRAAIEFLRAAPEVSQLIAGPDMRVWGETGRRLSATSAEAAADFFQNSAAVLQRIEPGTRAPVLRLVSKQAALSASTAVECYRASPRVIASIDNTANAAAILDICLELARHSVKHSYDLFLAAPAVTGQLAGAFGDRCPGVVSRALSLTSAFAFRSGGTASEFFSEMPRLTEIAASDDQEIESRIDKLLAQTERYLERSGGVALQYFKAASRVLILAGDDSFERWTLLATRVSSQGNAASYHFMKASPQVIAELAARAGADRRARIIGTVLEIVQEISKKNLTAAVECFKASPLALTAASLSQFRDWALRGLTSASNDGRKLQAYYGLESRASQDALFRVEGGLTLDSVAQTLRLYVEGLTGRALSVAPTATIPEEFRIGDGNTIYLPSVIAEFESEADNFRLFKVIAAHAAGQVEFGTYSKDEPFLVAAMREIRSSFGKSPNPPREDPPKRRRQRAARPDQHGLDFRRVLTEFQDAELATRLFTAVENARIDSSLRKMYKGIRRDLDFVREKLADQRPRFDSLPAELVPFEILYQVTICGRATDEARRAYPVLTTEMERIIADYVRRDDSTVSDSLIATSRIYSLFTQCATESDGSGSGEGGDLAANAAEPADGEPRQDEATKSEQRFEMRDDPLSFWLRNLPQETQPESDQFNRIGGESADQDLEKGDRPFYYDEWDRELGDYRTRWCRIIERAGSRGSRGFVDLVRNRYAGIISSVRYQFQLMRPENLRKVRGEIDGEDYDLQAVIDYALDKRSSGLIDDRLYTRKLRRERDVAVSFLLDMSSSTARTISRDPKKPYTQPGQRIIDIEKEGLVLMSEALEAVGDVYSMQGFTSEGRRNVKFYVMKDFSEPYSSDVERRIGGITYQNNTRLGAAIRHATTRLAGQDARTKLLIVLSDGRPYDHDYGDSRYAREDTRMALRQARLAGITPFCITIDRESEDQLRDMYGEVGYTIIDDVLGLPERLPGIYTRLTT